ncbi:MAG: RNA polymerase sigma factor [Ktedonobacterales bacterium]|nr:RNA polymerase sigma factor [Ktedonobacterales bacterium]
MNQDEDLALPTAVPTEAPSEARLTAVYAEYSARIHSYAFHLLGNQEDADDITQDVFIRAHSHLCELRDAARLRSWLYRIATNLCMDHLRRRTRQRRLFGIALPIGGREEEPAFQDIPQPGSMAMIDGVAERDHIRQALRSMPAKYATCLLLHSVQGLSYREIADILGISPGAAAVRLTRARSLFATYYDELKGEGRR